MFPTFAHKKILLSCFSPNIGGRVNFRRQITGLNNHDIRPAFGVVLLAVSSRPLGYTTAPNSDLCLRSTLFVS